MVNCRVCIVCYNSVANAPKEMQRIIALAKESLDCEWYFVDNSADSSDAIAIERELVDAPRATIIRRPENPGFAGAVNLAISDDGPRWLVLLNPDLEVDEYGLREIIAHTVRVGRSVGSIAIGQNTRGFLHRGVTLGPFGWFADRAAGGGSWKWMGRRVIGNGRLVGPSGGAAAYRVEALRGIGGFDATLFGWGEDVDVALRLLRAGWGVAESPVWFPHRGGHSVADRRSRRVRAYNLARNRWIVAGRHYMPSQVLRMACFQAMTSPALLARGLRDHTLVVQMQGTWDGLAAFRAARRAFNGARTTQGPANG